MMFETNHDGSISSGTKPWEDEKRFMSSLDQPELPGRNVSQTSRLTCE